nr:hypothetical protein [Tanacetum cinerariifolium]
AADLSEMELKKILIEKMEGNKSIQKDVRMMMIRKDPPLDQTGQMSASESAFAEEPVQTTYQMDESSHPVFETGAEDQPIVQTSQHPEWFSQPRKPPTPDRDWNKTLPAIQGSAQTWISELAKQADSRSSFNELLDTPIDFSNFSMNRLCPFPLIPDNRGRRVILFAHFINNDFEYLRGDLVPRTMWIQEPLNYDKHALWGVSQWGWKRQ